MRLYGGPSKLEDSILKARMRDSRKQWKRYGVSMYSLSSGSENLLSSRPLIVLVTSAAYELGVETWSQSSIQLFASVAAGSSRGAQDSPCMAPLQNEYRREPLAAAHVWRRGTRANSSLGTDGIGPRSGAD